MEQTRTKKGWKIIVLAVVLVILGGVIIVRIRPSCAREVLIRAKGGVKKTTSVRIPAGRTVEWTMEMPYTPCYVSGMWHSSRVDEKGFDDTIVSAEIRGVDGKRIQSWDHEVSGQFSFKVETPGMVKFRFSNAGIIRSTPRQVQIEVMIK